MSRLMESDDYIITNVLLLFLLINFNLQIGTIYGLMAVIDWVAYYIAIDRGSFKLSPIEKSKSSRFQNLVWGMGAYVAFIFIANFTSQNLSLITSGGALENISKLIAESFSATPILYGSQYLRLMVWGLLIPIIETRFFFRTLLDWGLSASGVSRPRSNSIGDLFTIKSLLVMGFFGALFSVFHIVAKGITNNSSLLVTFMFGVVSVGLVLYFGEAVQAIFLHIITNTIATMQQLGINVFGASGFNIEAGLILTGVFVATWLLLFQQLPFIGTKKARG